MPHAESKPLYQIDLRYVDEALVASERDIEWEIRVSVTPEQWQKIIDIIKEAP